MLPKGISGQHPMRQGRQPEHPILWDQAPTMVPGQNFRDVLRHCRHKQTDRQKNPKSFRQFGERMDSCTQQQGRPDCRLTYTDNHRSEWGDSANQEIRASASLCGNGRGGETTFTKNDKIAAKLFPSPDP